LVGLLFIVGYYRWISRNMSKRVDCPQVQGWVALRLLTSDGRPPDDFVEQYLCLEVSNTQFAQPSMCGFCSDLCLQDGCLRWFDDKSKLLGRGCGFIVSKVLTNSDNQQQSSSQQQQQTTKSTSSSKSKQLISLQILLKDGISIMELRAKTAKYWQSMLDLHFAHGPKHPPFIPDHYFAHSPSTFTSLSVSVTSRITLLDRVLEVPVSLMDDPELLAAEVMNHNHLTNTLSNGNSNLDVATTLAMALYKEQRKLILATVEKFQELEKDAFRDRLEQLSTLKRASDAEEHIARLTAHLDSIESLLPVLQDKLHSNSAPGPPAADTRDWALTADYHHDAPSLRLSTSRPQTPNRSVTPTNWRSKFEHSQSELETARLAARRAEEELQRNQRTSAYLQQIEQLHSENQQLREYSVALRCEVLALQQQITDLQEAALATLEAIQQERVPEEPQLRTYPAVVHADLTEPEGFNRHSGSKLGIQDFLSPMRESKQSIWCSTGHDMPNSDDEDEDVQPEQTKNSYHRTNSTTCVDTSQSPLSTFSSSGNQSSPLTKLLVRAMRWSLVQQRVLSSIYDHYSSGGKQQGVTMTRFFRFAKEFSITIADNNPSVGPTLTALDFHSNPQTLIYGEVSMIFTNASKQDTDDAYQELLKKRKGGVFKVKNQGSEVVHGHGNNSINATLTKEQFFFAIEVIGDRLFSANVADLTSDRLYENTIGNERQRIVQAAMELLWLKVLVPGVIGQSKS
jgi:hypothetical protein